jgi:hypothetical protein
MTGSSKPATNFIGADDRGKLFLRTEPGSAEPLCAVDKKDPAPYALLYCERAVSVGKPDVFASVYNQTLKDMRDCLLPAGWNQTTINQGACIPTGLGGGECVRRFFKGIRQCVVVLKF